jgi:hypothetical protein
MNTRYFHPAYRPFPAKVTNIFTQMGLKLQTSITLLYPPAPKLLNRGSHVQDLEICNRGLVIQF